MIKTLIGLSWQVYSPTHMCSLLDPLEIIFFIFILYYNNILYIILIFLFLFILNGQRKQCGKGDNTKMKEITMRQEVYQPGPDEEVLL